MVFVMNSVMLMMMLMMKMKMMMNDDDKDDDDDGNRVDHLVKFVSKMRCSFKTYVLAS